MAYRFDDVEIDAHGYRVLKSGAAVHLEPKAMELLLFLAANPGRLMTKTEIQAAVWRDSFVTENALTRLIAQIRRTLGDEARAARYIETVPTKGYRFVAPLATPATATLPVPSEAEPVTASPQPTAAEPASPGGQARLSDGGGGPPLGVSAAANWGRGLRVAAGCAMLLAATFVVLAVRLPPARSAARAALPSILETQISTGAQLNVFPRFSPDGGSLAFSTLRAGSLEIVVRALAAGAREVPVTSDGMQNVQPAFSPDGRLIAYHSVGRGGLWLVPALGGVPRRLTAWGSAPAWSPDGSRIAFQSQAWVGSSAGQSPAGEGSTIWLVSPGGGDPVPLTSVAQVGPGGQGAPAWSPDGRLISFLAGTRVMTVRPDGSGLRQTSRDLWANGVAWEESGRSQVWTGSQAGNWVAWRVPVSPETGDMVGAPRVLAGGGETAAAWFHPAVSPDGRSLAHVTFRTRHEILSQEVDARGLPSGEPRALVSNVAGRKVPLGFSPDGRTLAFGTVRPGVGRALWIADAASGEARLLVERPGLVWSRGFFPDGRLGYLGTAQGRSVLSSIDPESGATADVSAVDTHLSWPPLLSRDGMRLAAHGALRGGLDVWIVDLKAGVSRQLTSDTEGIGWPVWSPDGTRLAVEMMRNGETRIGVLPATGGALHEVVGTPGQNWPESFSPDGRRIAFAGQRRGLWNVYWAPLDGGSEQRVTAYETPALYVRYPQWSPRGDRIAYEYGESTSTVWTRPLPLPE